MWVIADEIYARILFSGEYKSIWALPGMAERTVIIDGFSKSFAMTGWRLGYAVAQKHVIDALDMLVLNTFTCTAEFSQVAAIEALLDSTNAVPAMVEEYRKRRDLFVEKLNKIPGFRCQSPDGAFYAWVNIEETGKSAEEVQKNLAGRGGRGGDCRSGIWSGREELRAILAGQRDAPAGRGAGTHSARNDALARRGVAMTQSLRPKFCLGRMLDMNHVLRMRSRRCLVRRNGVFRCGASPALSLRRREEDLRTPAEAD